jgi:hypothetical protein
VPPSNTPRIAKQLRAAREEARKASGYSCVGRPETDGVICRAAVDGECVWKGCPQLRDGEPRRTGRSCPLVWPQDLDL